MFQFPGLALNPYVFRAQYLHVISVSPKTGPSTGSTTSDGSDVVNNVLSLE